MVSANGNITGRLVEALYTEAMLLADETRSYLDAQGTVDRDTLPPRGRVSFACETLNGSTRLMHVTAWLLTRRAVHSGELSDRAGGSRRLSVVPETDEETLDGLPSEARRLIEAGVDLYERVRRLDQGTVMIPRVSNPAHSLFQRLEQAF